MISVINGIENREHLAQLYREIGSTDRLLISAISLDFHEAMFSRIKDQDILAGFLLEKPPAVRTDDITKCLLSHINRTELLKNIALNASDDGMFYAADPRKSYDPHYVLHGRITKWSYTQEKAAVRIKDYDVLADLLIQNGYRPAPFGLLEEHGKKKYFQLLSEKGNDAHLKSEACRCLSDILPEPNEKLYCAARILSESNDQFTDIVRQISKKKGLVNTC